MNEIADTDDPPHGAFQLPTTAAAAGGFFGSAHAARMFLFAPSGAEAL
jgi:hypothetical protein